MYGVKHLGVQHVVVCGHTSCGGVAAALGNDRLGVIDAWLAPIRKLREANKSKWDAEGLSDKDKAVRLVEANVRQGVQTVLENAEVIDAVKERGLQVHGLVYDVACGELRELKIEEGEQEGKKRVEAFALK